MTVATPGMAVHRHDPMRAIPMLDEAARLFVDHDMGAFRLYLRGFRSYAQLQTGDWAAAEA